MDQTELNIRGAGVAHENRVITDENEARARMKELEELLRYHIDRYFNLDSPEITDYEYDQLSLELRALERDFPQFASENSPTRTVGGTAKRTAGVLVAHRVPMLSIQDVFSKEDVENWIKDMREKLGESTAFLVETKIDGLSLSLRYERGRLVTAVTRGDGRIQGEDVTENARVMDDVKETIDDAPEYLEIRGEVYMDIATFKAVNEKQESLGKKPFANPRNCAAGTLRQLDPAVTRERGLSMFIFNLQDAHGVSFETHEEVYDYLRSRGIKTINLYYVCKTEEEVWDAIEKIREARSQLPYDIDGAVVKLNRLADRDKCPDTAKNAGFMIAYKYPPEEKETVLRQIELSVGRTGKISPTAVFDPIRLCQTTVSRATLHNQDYIDALDIRIGDTIVVYKSGEIIPKVKKVVKSKRKEGSKPFKIPGVCPVCGAPVVRDKDTSDMKCTGAACPAQLERLITNFVGRDAMDIKGFGEKYVKELISRGYIADISDIYYLKDHRAKLIEEGIIGKEKNTDKLLAAIENSKQNEPSRLLTGLGIPNVGKSAAKALVASLGSIDAIARASEEELTVAEDVGTITASAVRAYFDTPQNVHILDRMKAAGVTTEQVQSTQAGQEQKLSGLTFVITGTLPGMDRKEAAALIEKNGGRVTGSVSKKTDYLLAGEAAGSKLTKAQSLGTKIIDEATLLEMIRG